MMRGELIGRHNAKCKLAQHCLLAAEEEQRPLWLLLQDKCPVGTSRSGETAAMKSDHLERKRVPRIAGDSAVRQLVAAQRVASSRPSEALRRAEVSAARQSSGDTVSLWQLGASGPSAPSCTRPVTSRSVRAIVTAAHSPCCTAAARRSCGNASSERNGRSASRERAPASCSVGRWRTTCVSSSVAAAPSAPNEPLPGCEGHVGAVRRCSRRAVPPANSALLASASSASLRRSAIVQVKTSSSSRSSAAVWAVSSPLPTSSIGRSNATA
eukprot:7390185-Prymnesium_polylepis.2